MPSLARARVWPNVVVGLVVFVSVAVVGQERPAQPGGPATSGVGLIRNDPGAFQGYTLVSPLQSKSTFLIDMEGRVVRTWETDATPSSIAYLLENGNLLRPSQLANPTFGGRTAGAGGKVQEISWSGGLGLHVRQRHGHSAPRSDAAPEWKRAARRGGKEDRR